MVSMERRKSFVKVLQERSRILLRFADLIDKHDDELAALETWDNGKPYEQAAKIEEKAFSLIQCISPSTGPVSRFSDANFLYKGNTIHRQSNSALLLEEIKEEILHFESIVL